MIHVFHGFLGTPQDFYFLGSAVKLHDLYALNEISNIGPEDTLIGYSMGGRMALELASTVHFKLKRLVLINAHPGLAADEERLQRRSFEESVLQKLETLERKEFLLWWNALPIFEHDTPIAPDEEIFRRSPELFRRHRLSDQKNFLDDLEHHREKVLYVVGLQDEKYMDLVSEVLLPRELKIKGIPGGHRLFQQPHALSEVLREEGIL